MRRLINTAYNYLYFRVMKWQADTRHKTTGKQYHIVPMAGRLYIINNTDHKLLNRICRKTKGRQITFKELLEKSYYSTPAKR